MGVLVSESQSADQAGFKPGFCCEDHLFTVTMLYEKCHEWGGSLWIAAVDFKKAFDTVEHEYLWRSLSDADVPGEYIDVSKRLYALQVGTIVADQESQPFKICRGTKQGDPISPPLLIRF